MRLVHTNASIRESVLLFFFDNVKSEKKDGPIESWDTSGVTDMSFLFKNRRRFNRNISNWDVSSVTNMRAMFKGASLFNQPLNWDVSSVTTFRSMFFFAVNFRSDLSRWDVSSALDMTLMFGYAARFQSNLGQWKVEGVTKMDFMFRHAEKFDSNLELWSLSTETFPICPLGMFDEAHSFSWRLNSKFDTIYKHWRESRRKCMDAKAFNEKLVAMQLIEPITAWRIKAAERAYMPGGPGYLRAKESFAKFV